jgi:hypothetical protein
MAEQRTSPSVLPGGGDSQNGSSFEKIWENVTVFLLYWD